MRLRRNQVINWLVNKYGAAVKPRSKAVYIDGSGARRNADVLIAADLRRWYTYKSPSNNAYADGICFFNSSGQRIDNFPKQHSANCTTKHQNTNRWFKQTVRTFKNARNKLIGDYKIDDGLAPSYFIEGLLYNVPADRFGGGESANFNDVLLWLLAADRSKLVCANEMFYFVSSHSARNVTRREVRQVFERTLQLVEYLGAIVRAKRCGVVAGVVGDTRWQSCFCCSLLTLQP